jgi:arabinan endo-1,5-alpha-L-arabinosidase
MRSGRVILAIYFLNIMALTDNLRAFYKLSDLTDSSGNNRTLTNNGNVSFASGKLGNAAVFDDSNWLESPASIPFESNATVSVWFKPTVLDNSYGTIVGFYPGLNIAASDANTISVDDFTQPFISGPSLSVDTWYHAVVKVQSGVCYVYVNNSLVASEASILLTGNSFRIGGEIGYNFNGQIDAVGIWNRALSDAEVAELYNNGTGLELDGVAQPTLVKMQAPVKFFGKVKFGV